VKSPFYGDFQGLLGKRGKRLYVFLSFPSDRHFHRFRAPVIFSTIVNESYQRDVTRHDSSIEVDTAVLPVNTARIMLEAWF
jgi:hypothetical protein